MKVAAYFLVERDFLARDLVEELVRKSSLGAQRHLQEFILDFQV
jgi:hypothetical protein